jgi:hypothetical protein
MGTVDCYLEASYTAANDVCGGSIYDKLGYCLLLMQVPTASILNE